MTARTRFVSTDAARDWEHGLVVGTGTVGGVLFGDPACHRLQLCHEEFFVPRSALRPAPRFDSVLGALRDALTAARYDEADALFDDAIRRDGDAGLVWTDPFLPLGGLTWTPAPAPDSEAATHEYRRTGDFRSGRIEVSWRQGGERAGIAVSPDREGGVLWVELWADGGGAGLLALDGPDGSPVTVSTDERSPAHVDRGDAVRAEAPEVAPGSLRLRVAPTLDPEVPRSPWAATGGAISATVEGEAVTEVRGSGLRITLPPGQRVRVRVEVAVTTDAAPMRPRVHAPHAELFDRSRLDLGSGVSEDLPLEELLRRARSGDESARRAAIELAFAAGRHAIISSSGALPPTLVGLWQGSSRPAWSADYTQNGNVQHGAIASLVAGGTPELIRAYFDALARHHDDYAANAARVFGAPGWLLPARFSTHGHANHLIPAFPHPFWIGAGGWALRLAWDYVITTGDLDFARAEAWPLAVQTMAFFDTAAVPVEGGRRLVPSYSPENTPAGRNHPLSLDATMDVAIVRDAARLTERLADLLGIDDTETRARCRRLRAELPPYRVAADGTFAEWLAPGVGENLAHRHVSQLYPFWYEQDEAAETPPLRAAAVETIRRKLAWRASRPFAPPEGNLEMVFGYVGLGLAAARLGEAELARECVERMAVDHWRPNAVSTHDADAIFNVDACGGLPAVVIEMLVQSQPGEVHLLPALPAAWHSGAIEGIRCRGGVVVDRLEWEGRSLRARFRLAPRTAAIRTDDRVRIRAFGIDERRRLGDEPVEVVVDDRRART
ncbi:glycosyl hydrolase family 95 catalytic domain-containing protein [Microbacterium sp. TNHR37B]|uniref:glycosyl hydrolase family 95 catalytic domain-containing protein n=1 Tax=Microbacterium sp. TNHR37B TaxID=1775956 RepID=UPI0007B257A1|nr:glycoside hydrolase N-terminal domain-containing protein [Microbacterium sp. TNHR37B]KZE88429.1 hypothetical protein AVP41_02933 [Microbacterium sp. TNHR37B]